MAEHIRLLHVATQLCTKVDLEKLEEQLTPQAGKGNRVADSALALCRAAVQFKMVFIQTSKDLIHDRKAVSG